MSVINYAQENITSELEKAYGEEKYDLIISEHSDKVSEYPAKAIYYVAVAYYMKANDNKVLELMDLSIQKDKTDPDTYFIKGMTFNYIGQFDKAIESFNKAIELDSTNSNYFSGLGDSYFSQEKYDKALSVYRTATEKNEPIDRPFTMIPQIYAELNQPEKALEAFYKSKATISKESDSYINALYNIGLYEYLNKEYNKSEIAFKELIELVPNDYHSHAKLIQVYYGKKEYEKAKPLKDMLYKAYEQGKLTDNLKSMFCFDQFEWNGKLIFAYERFAVKEGELYYKHIFYVPNEKGETEFTIQTENSPISVELGGPKYAVGMDRNGTHSTFVFIDENFKYDDLKKIVIKIIDKQIEPSASSRKGKK
ncbi:Tetratricopeptide repeat protein [Mariniflexile rhizosphaerae]|uniref:tetratricopeptide repeat protein n=1 Tax=unclassified Mariniflexile TaxID=2643887 RepID=UPI000E333A46|nr:tetratricopeptide repeat protein [Mariniflexile sp. TRM1-10]AXP81590.1 Tetratricopeptide repeat protein [Mariniflexile sp. TRM1-10]